MAYSSSPKNPREFHRLYASNINALRSRQKKKELSGIFVFYGEEIYLKDHYFREFVRLSGAKMMDVQTLDSESFTVKSFIESVESGSVQTVDMFADEPTDGELPFRIVRLFSPKISEKDIPKAELSHFFEKLADLGENVTVVFILDLGEDDKVLSKSYKTILENSHALAVNFTHEPLGSPVLISWVSRHFIKAGVQISQDVAAFTVDYVGNDMTTLVNEIHKCVMALKTENRDTVTEADIRAYCRQSIHAQIFDIAENALSGKYALSMRAFQVYRKAGENPLLLFGTVAKQVSDLAKCERSSRNGENAFQISKATGIREFVVRNNLAVLALRGRDYASYAVKILADYEEKLKGGSLDDPYALLAELIFKLAVTTNFNKLTKFEKF